MKRIIQNQKAKEMMNNWETWQKPILEVKEYIREEKERIKIPRQRLTTSKKTLWFLIVNFSVIEFFSILLTFLGFKYTGMIDMTAMSGLIAAVCGETVSYLVYSAKAAKENVSHIEGEYQLKMGEECCEERSDDMYG